MGGFSTGYGSSRSYDYGRDSSVTKKSAKSYAKDDNRNFTGGEGLAPPVGKEIKSNSPYASIFIVDVTGSMQDWPKLIFEKIPTLYSESNAIFQGADLKNLEKGKKLEDKLDISVIAVGDAAGDSYPLQVTDFSKGAKLVKSVNSIYPEGGGGGNKEESYDLAIYYALNHCKTPNVPKQGKPLLVIAGDEGFYKKIKASWVKKLIGDKLKSDLDTKDVIKKTMNKFDTYILRPEPMYDEDTYATIHKQWQEALGAQRVLKMKDPSRLVDCFIGVCGYAANNFDLSKDLLERRQTSKQVDEVLKTLHPLLSSKKTSSIKKSTGKRK